MQQTLERVAGNELARRLESFPVVVVSGARQTGKSTLVKSVGGPSSRYLTLDDFGTLDQATQAPAALLGTGERVILDEVQRAPDLLLAIKMAVDQQRTTGRFLLTGSANLLMMKRVSESLAGRAVYLTLWPLTRREKLGLAACGAWSAFFDHPPSEWLGELPLLPGERVDWRALAIEGGFPDPGFHLRNDPAARADWFDGYVTSYLERDLRELAAVQDLVAFQRLMQLAALRVGGVLNQSDLARDAGLPVSTAQRYLDLLVTSYQMVRVPAYAVNRTKRLVKSPKLYWSDPGLAMHLAGESEPRGEHLENLVLHDLLVWKELQVGRPQLLYWRTRTREEVDFVIEWRGRLLPVEVKSSRRVSYAETHSLRAFLAEYPEQTSGGVMLYDGTETYWLAEGILAVPWSRVV